MERLERMEWMYKKSNSSRLPLFNWATDRHLSHGNWIRWMWDNNRWSSDIKSYLTHNQLNPSVPQKSKVSGTSGEAGHPAHQLVGTASEWDDGRVEMTPTHVLETPQRPRIARWPNAQVFLDARGNMLQKCLLFTDPVTEWEDWGEWSQCSATCGPGIEFRARSCNKPFAGGNETCPGNATEAKVCNLVNCPGLSQ